MRERLQALGLEASPLAAAELDGLLRKERSMWSTIVETAGIKVE
jgi:hypothetical protein